MEKDDDKLAMSLCGPDDPQKHDGTGFPQTTGNAVDFDPGIPLEIPVDSVTDNGN